MKLIVKLMLALLVLAALLPFTLLKNDRGSPLMSFSDFRLPDFSLASFPGVPAADNSGHSASGSAGTVVFYKWYDASDNVQFTTDPPPDGIDYTVKEYDPDTNLIQAVKLPEEKAAATTPEPASHQESPIQEQINPYDPEQIRKLFEDTKNIEKLLQQRMENRDSEIN